MLTDGRGRSQGRRLGRRHPPRGSGLAEAGRVAHEHTPGHGVNERSLNFALIKAEDHDFHAPLCFIDPLNQPVDAIARLDE